MIFHTDFTVLDMIGILIGLIGSAYIFINFYFDQKARERSSRFDTDPLEPHDKRYKFVLGMDLIVGLFLLYLNFFESGYYFGRSMIVLTGYLLFNWSISMFSDQESDSDNKEKAWAILFVGSCIMAISFFSAMSFVEFLMLALEAIADG